MTPELAQLLDELRALRAGVLKKTAGLGEEAARRSTVGSGTNIAGLLAHLAFVEEKWFAGNVAGRRVRRDRSMHVDPTTTLAALRADYRAACATSDAIIVELGDADALVRFKGQAKNLRWAMLAVLTETARHAGHADIIREQLDGVTGR